MLMQRRKTVAGINLLLHTASREAELPVPNPTNTLLQNQIKNSEQRLSKAQLDYEETLENADLVGVKLNLVTKEEAHLKNLLAVANEKFERENDALKILQNNQKGTDQAITKLQQTLIELQQQNEKTERLCAKQERNLEQLKHFEDNDQSLFRNYCDQLLETEELSSVLSKYTLLDDKIAKDIDIHLCKTNQQIAIKRNELREAKQKRTHSYGNTPSEVGQKNTSQTAELKKKLSEMVERKQQLLKAIKDCDSERLDLEVESLRKSSKATDNRTSNQETTVHLPHANDASDITSKFEQTRSRSADWMRSQKGDEEGSDVTTSDAGVMSQMQSVIAHEKVAKQLLVNGLNDIQTAMHDARAESASLKRQIRLKSAASVQNGITSDQDKAKCEISSLDRSINRTTEDLRLLHNTSKKLESRNRLIREGLAKANPNSAEYREMKQLDEEYKKLRSELSKSQRRIGEFQKLVQEAKSETV